MRIRTMIVGSGKGKGKQNMLQQMGKQMGKRGSMNPHNMQMNVQQMSRMLPPQVRMLSAPCACCCPGNKQQSSLASRQECFHA